MFDLNTQIKKNSIYTIDSIYRSAAISPLWPQSHFLTITGGSAGEGRHVSRVVGTWR